jgi:hypothetical protein
VHVVVQSVPVPAHPAVALTMTAVDHAWELEPGACLETSGGRQNPLTFDFLPELRYQILLPGAAIFSKLSFLVSQNEQLILPVGAAFRRDWHFRADSSIAAAPL